ncbi:MAG: hypothetical protein Q7U20_08745 [Caulobacter sp.]|nr:hypothetical protein [Caulobacter sp.]
MIQIAVLVAALACQSPPPPAAPVVPNAQAAKGDLGFVVKPDTAPLARQSGADFLRSQATPPAPGATPAPAAPQPSVADLFRERNAREAAAKATESAPSAVADGQYHCRRTENATTCGNDEEAMRRLEAEIEERRRRLETPS